MKWGCVAAFLGVFYLVGFLVIGFAVQAAWQSVRAASWPVAPARLTTLELTSESDGDGGTTHNTKVEYEYAVNGTTYTGSRVAFGYSGTNDKVGQQQIHDKLKGAQNLSVRYDPADPSRSCLSAGFHQSIQFLFAFGVFWLVFTAGFTVLIWVGSQPNTVLLDNLLVR